MQKYVARRTVAAFKAAAEALGYGCSDNRTIPSVEQCNVESLTLRFGGDGCATKVAPLRGMRLPGGLLAVER